MGAVPGGLVGSTRFRVRARDEAPVDQELDEEVLVSRGRHVRMGPFPHELLAQLGSDSEVVHGLASAAEVEGVLVPVVVAGVGVQGVAPVSDQVGLLG